MTEDKLSLARVLAIEWHEGQMFNGLPYHAGHLSKVVANLCVFHDPGDLEMLIAGWLHDGPEDVPEDDEKERIRRLRIIENEFGPRVHALVWAVTGIGDSRKERIKDSEVKIRAFPESAILKAADRFVNVTTSKVNRPSLFKRYVREYDEGFRDLMLSFIPMDILYILDDAHGWKP